VAKVEQLWSDVHYWRRRGKPKAAAIYCRTIIDEHPNSEFVIPARKMLAELEGRDERAATVKLAPVPDEGQPESGKTSVRPGNAPSRSPSDSAANSAGRATLR
jgi:hypothetical protein